MEVVVLSEYGISKVSRPVHLNRDLPGTRGGCRSRTSWGGKLLDAGACRVLRGGRSPGRLMIYLNDPGILRSEVRTVLEETEGVEEVREELFRSGSRGEAGEEIWWRWRLPRPGSPITIGTIEAVAPDFARTVDIHRKPGYDPAELCSSIRPSAVRSCEGGPVSFEEEAGIPGTARA